LGRNYLTEALNSVPMFNTDINESYFKVGHDCVGQHVVLYSCSHIMQT